MPRAGMRRLVRMGHTTLMSLFQGVRHERSSPDQLGSKCLAEGRAWPGAAHGGEPSRTTMGQITDVRS